MGQRVVQGSPATLKIPGCYQVGMVGVSTWQGGTQHPTGGGDPLRSRLWPREVTPGLRRATGSGAPGEPSTRPVSVGNGGLSSSLHVGGGWEDADGSTRQSSSCSSTAWNTALATSWECCCWHSRDLSSELLREGAGAQTLGCRQCLIPSCEAGAIGQSVPACKRSRDWLKKRVVPIDLDEEIRLGRIREGKEIKRICTGKPEVRKSEPHGRGSQRL